MINMCDTEKVIVVERRVLIYYKYDFLKADCVKIIRSKYPTQRLSIRFLQVTDWTSLLYSYSPLAIHHHR